MGWGCYKHEWDAGSENWDKALGELCDRKLTEKPLTFGREEQICPSCYTELETALAAMTKERDAQAEAVRVLAVAVSFAWYSTDFVRQANAFAEAFNNPIAAAAVKGEQDS